MNYSTEKMKIYIKKFYKTLKGKPVEKCSNYQILAVYQALKRREALKEKTLMTNQELKEFIENNYIILYTDGACRNNQSKENIGAWAYKLEYKGNQKTEAESTTNTTNNKMELMAIIKGLEAIKPEKRKLHKVLIISDSMYAIQGINTWLPGWLKINFKKVKNPELWKQINELISQFKNVVAKHVKGHEETEGNIFVDNLCNKAMDSKTN